MGYQLISSSSITNLSHTHCACLGLVWYLNISQYLLQNTHVFPTCYQIRMTRTASIDQNSKKILIYFNSKSHSQLSRHQQIQALYSCCMILSRLFDKHLASVLGSDNNQVQRAYKIQNTL